MKNEVKHAPVEAGNFARPSTLQREVLPQKLHQLQLTSSHSFLTKRAQEKSTRHENELRRWVAFSSASCLELSSRLLAQGPSYDLRHSVNQYTQSVYS
jgi:hypothetical protein